MKVPQAQPNHFGTPFKVINSSAMNFKSYVHAQNQDAFSRNDTKKSGPFNAHWVRNINYVNVLTTRKLLV